MSVTTTQAVLTAGTTLEVEDPDNLGTWLDIPEILTLGVIGAPGTFVDSTPIDITTGTRVYTEGLKDPPENTMTYNLRDGDANQTSLRNWAIAQRTVQFRINSSTNVVAQTTVALSGYSVEYNDAGAVVVASVNYRARQAWTWTP